jgi:ribosomal protein L40E
MICTQCHHDNPPEALFCQQCGTPLKVEKIEDVEEIGQIEEAPVLTPRFLPPEKAPIEAYYLCPRCGMPIPQGTTTCSRCRWDLRQPYKRPPRFTLGGCLGMLVMRLLSGAVASGVSFVIGLVSANIGLGATLSSLITGLISTLLSMVPSIFGWFIGLFRRPKAAY